MKERPILFSGPMVKAILAGRKTQTRRIMKQQPDTVVGNGEKMTHARWWNEKGSFPMNRSTVANFICPYGLVGDRLWVRESWAVSNIYDCLSPSKICRDILEREGYPKTKPPCGVRYPATDSMSDGIRCRPSIHMPRWASRITLEITGVRVERVQDISNADCCAEGIVPIGAEKDLGNCCGTKVMAQAGVLNGRYSTVRQLYSELWNKINGNGSWSSNPWVWVVCFKRVNNE